MRLSEVLGRSVVTESGEKLGHVYDVRVKRDERGSADRAGQKWQVRGLVVGRRGLIERLGLAGAADRRPLLDHDVVPWSAILRIGDEAVIARDGTKLE
jgi:sporulation protein YlmC with PRC-barrel domain